jgi:hypothetical protein
MSLTAEWNDLAMFNYEINKILENYVPKGTELIYGTALV